MMQIFLYRIYSPTQSYDDWTINFDTVKVFLMIDEEKGTRVQLRVSTVLAAYSQTLYMYVFIYTYTVHKLGLGLECMCRRCVLLCTLEESMVI